MRAPLGNSLSSRGAHNAAVMMQPRPGPGEWKLELYETASGQEPFDVFLSKLDQHQLITYERTFGMGERLAGRREELGLTQGQVSERSGVRQSDISRIECGKANPPQATLEKIAAALEARLTLVPLSDVH